MAQSPARQERYALRVVGEIPSIADDAAAGLSARGDVCFFRLTPAGAVRAALFRNGVLQDLGPASSELCTLARAVAADGLVVGWSVAGRNPVDSRAAVRACRLREGALEELPTLGGTESRAFCVNDHGWIAGVGALPDGRRRAFVIVDGKIQNLSNLPDAQMSAAYGINQQGHLVGVSADSRGTLRACLWRDGAPRDLGTFPGGKGATARAINERGQVAGFARTDDEEIHAFLWEKDRMIDLGTLGAEPSAANALNNCGQIVGSSQARVRGRRLRAFLWQQGRLIDLNERIPGDAGVTLHEAFGINDAGQIVCVGSDRSGRRLVTLLTPR